MHVPIGHKTVSVSSFVAVERSDKPVRPLLDAEAVKAPLHTLPGPGMTQG